MRLKYGSTKLETTEAVRLIQHKGPLPVGGFYDIEEIVSFARKGGTLTMAQLLKVLYNMKTAERVKAFLKGDVPDLPVLMALRAYCGTQGSVG